MHMSTRGTGGTDSSSTRLHQPDQSFRHISTATMHSTESATSDSFIYGEDTQVYRNNENEDAISLHTFNTTTTTTQAFAAANTAADDTYTSLPWVRQNNKNRANHRAGIIKNPYIVPENDTHLSVKVHVPPWDPDQPDEEDGDAKADLRRYGPGLTKDGKRPIETVRMWVLGLICVVVGSTFNTVLSMRGPSIALPTLLAQWFSYYLGRLWERYMPTGTYTWFGRQWNLNPGAFTEKEHTCITVMSTVGFGNDYVSSFILTYRVSYGLRFGFLFEVLLSWTVQLYGLALAGLCRRFVVYPKDMKWPSCCAQTTMIHALHRSPDPPAPNDFYDSISRRSIFKVVTVITAFYHWFPLFIMPILSTPAFVTWFLPDRIVVNQIFGQYQGLSIVPFTLDWSVISTYWGSPLTVPWWAAANILVGFFVIYFAGGLILNFTNTWYGDYLPLSESGIYDRFQKSYDAASLLTDSGTFDYQKYLSYSPPFLATTFALAYGVSFAAVSAVLPFTLLKYGPRLKKMWNRQEEDDVHTKLMRGYPEVPDWWYLILLVVIVMLALVASLAWPTGLKAWNLLLSLLLAALFLIPACFIAAKSNIVIGLNVLIEFLIGYLQPGQALPMMIFKTYGYITINQGLMFVSDIKLAHYMKVPQRILFRTQLVATCVGAFVDVAVTRIMLAKVDGLCTSKAPSNMTCPQAHIFFNASLIWGIIGPSHIFSPGQIYAPLLFFIPIGFALPILFFFLAKRWPKSWLKDVNFPVMFAGCSMCPPATTLNFVTFGGLCWLFNSRIKHVNPLWWARYTYIISCGLDLGVALTTVLITFCFSLPGIRMKAWWGTNVGLGTVDWLGTAYRKYVPEGETFGPSSWT